MATTLAAFFSGQMDYVFFIYGLGFVFTAVVALLIQEREGSRASLPWFYLILFGFLHGLREWVDLFSMTVGSQPSVGAVRAGLLILSFVCLLEFGRAGYRRLRGRGAGRWIFLPLFFVTFLGTEAGIAGLEDAARYSLGLIGGLWAAAAFYEAWRGGSGRRSPWLLCAAIAMALYAVAAGLVVTQAPFFPAFVLNRTSFLAWIGIPIELFRGCFAFFIGASLWCYDGASRRAGAADARVQEGKYAKLLFSVALLTILTLGWFLTDALGRQEDERQRQNLSLYARTVAMMLMPEGLATLTGTSADLERREYQQLRVHLLLSRYANPACRQVYLMRMRGGKIVFLADSEPEHAPPGWPELHTDPGVSYDDAPPALREVFRTRFPATTAPYADRWGSWISAYYPVPNSEEVVGVNIGASLALSNIAMERFQPICLTLLITMLLMGSFLYRQRMREITRRVAERERQFKTAVRTALDGFQVLDTEGRILDVNEAYCQMTGFSRAELLTMNVIDLSERSAEEVQRSLRRIREAGGDRYESRHRRRDGGSVDVEISAQYIAENGGRLFTFLRDVTERKRADEALRGSEERYRTLVQKIPVGIYQNTPGAEGHFITANPAIVRMFGYESAEDFLKVSVSDLYMNPAERQAFSEQLLAAGQVVAEELRLKARDGRPIWAALTATVVRDAQGQVKYFEGIVQDITERKGAEEALKRANTELLRLTKIRSEFTSMVSHELRTPLASIRQAIDLVLRGVDGPTTEAQDQALGIALKNIDRLAHLIDNILDLQRIDAGRMELRFAPGDFNDVGRDVFESLKPTADKAEVHLSLVVAPHPLVAAFDADRMKQVLINLVGNAIKFTDAGGMVTVSLSHHKGQIRAAIADTGIGIKEEDLPRLFTRFGQIEEEGRKKPPGSGLGLAISKDIVELHRGTISVESTYGEGSAFTVAFPDNLPPSA